MKGIEIEVFNGVDGRDFFPEAESINKFPREFFEEHGLSYERTSIWNKSQLGCAMSNLNVQKKIIESDLKNALILEDDAFIIPQQLNNFEKAITELPDNWELFYLGYNNVSHWADNSFTRAMLRIKYKLKPVLIGNDKSSNTPDKMFLPKSFSKSLYTPGVYYGTHAYALSQAGAKKIVELDTPLNYGYDIALIHACYNKIVRGFALKKTLFIPEPGAGTTLV